MPHAGAGRRKAATVCDPADWRVEHPGGFGDALFDDCRGLARNLEVEAHIFGHCHMRIKRIGLKHHGDVAFARRHLIDDVAADQDVTFGDFLEPRNHAQQRGLSAAGRSDERDEFAIGYLQRNTMDDAKRAVDLRISFSSTDAIVFSSSGLDGAGRQTRDDVFLR